MKMRHRSQPTGGEFLLEDDQGEPRGELTYRRKGSEVTVTHTRVDEELRGRGLGRRLVDLLLGWAREEGLVVGATCSFARRVLDEQNTPRPDVR